MLKKLLIAVVAVAVGLTVVKSTKLGGLIRVKWNEATAWCAKQVPVETEIARLRDDLSRLGNDTKTHYSAVAEEMVKVENLKKDISDAEGRLANQKKRITAYRDALNEGGNQRVAINGEMYSRTRVEKQLARDFNLYKTSEAELAQKRKLLESRQECLAKAKEQLAAMQDMRRDLEVQLSELEAQYNTLKVAQTRSKFNLDDSALSKVKDGIAALRARIDKDAKVLALEAEFGDGPVPAPTTAKTKDLLKEIDEHFGKAEAGKVASK